MVLIKVDFVMGPYKGGGPRNVYTLSRMLNSGNVKSKVIQFIDPKYFSFLSKNYFDENTLNADVSRPGAILSYANAMFEIITHSPSAISFPFVSVSMLSRFLTVSTEKASDIVIGTDWGTFHSAKFLADKNNSKLFYFVQADERTFYNGLLYRSLAENTYHRQIPRFTQSKWLKTFLDNEFGGINHYIGFGINEIFFLPIESNNFKKNIFTIARSGKAKGFDLFVKALNSLYETRKDFTVTIAGERTALDGLKINFQYNFIGWVEDYETMKTLYNGSIFVHTGRNEALPMPPLEAMASCASVIVSDIPGTLEYANHEWNCLVSINDNPVSIKNNINRLLDDENLRANLQKNALITASEYKWKNVMMKLREVLTIDT